LSYYLAIGGALNRVLHKIFVVVDSLENANNAWLCADPPDEILMCDSVGHTHALFVDYRQLRAVNCGGVVTVVAQIAKIVRQPGKIMR
jgi:hypothetical protein